jgi:hypothetical protein
MFQAVDVGFETRQQILQRALPPAHPRLAPQDVVAMASLAPPNAAAMAHHAFFGSLRDPKKKSICDRDKQVI